MILRVLTSFLLLAATVTAAPAAKQEKVTVATMRDVSNGALFISAVRGYFKAAGLALTMQAYASPQAVVKALNDGAADLALTSFSASAFALAGKGAIKAIAAQVREKRGHEGNVIVASNQAYALGLRTVDDLAGRTVAVTAIGSIYHYELGQLARIGKVDLGKVGVKPVETPEAMMQAVAAGSVDAAILPVQYGHDILEARHARLIGWYEQFGEQQLGALFASATTLQSRHAMVVKFVNAYRRGAADFSVLSRFDAGGHRVIDAKANNAARDVAHYAFPDLPPRRAVAAVESAAFSMDPEARLDVADIERQMAWYKAQGLIAAAADPRNAVDMSFGRPGKAKP